MKNESEERFTRVPDTTPAKNDEFSFEMQMKKQSKEIVIKDFVPKLTTKPSDEQIDKASNYLHSFRMGIFTGSPVMLERAVKVEDRVNEILNEPTRLDTSRRARRSKKSPHNKAA